MDQILWGLIGQYRIPDYNLREIGSHRKIYNNLTSVLKYDCYFERITLAAVTLDLVLQISLGSPQCLPLPLTKTHLSILLVLSLAEGI